MTFSAQVSLMLDEEDYRTLRLRRISEAEPYRVPAVQTNFNPTGYTATVWLNDDQDM